MAQSLGLALINYAQALTEMNPDLLLLLGDRYETLSAALACQILQIPVLHCHGGEVTAGALDDAFRHSISKMATVHFPCTEAAARRLQQLGESPASIHPTSAFGIEFINRTKLLSIEELSSSLNVDFSRPTILVSYHSVTNTARGPADEFGDLLAALQWFPEIQFLFTSPNSDAGSGDILKLLDAYVEHNSGKAWSLKNLGQVRYLSALQHSLGLIGNSSSGILETPRLQVGSLNIGERQSGRERATSVIDCDGDVEGIRNGLSQLLNPTFRSSLANVQSPYGMENASETVLRVLRANGIYKGPKSFYDQIGLMTSAELPSASDRFVGEKLRERDSSQ